MPKDGKPLSPAQLALLIDVAAGNVVQRGAVVMALTAEGGRAVRTATLAAIAHLLRTPSDTEVAFGDRPVGLSAAGLAACEQLGIAVSERVVPAIYERQPEQPGQTQPEPAGGQPAGRPDSGNVVLEDGVRRYDSATYLCVRERRLIVIARPLPPTAKYIPVPGEGLKQVGEGALRLWLPGRPAVLFLREELVARIGTQPDSTELDWEKLRDLGDGRSTYRVNTPERVGYLYRFKNSGAPIEIDTDAGPTEVRGGDFVCDVRGPFRRLQVVVETPNEVTEVINVLRRGHDVTQADVNSGVFFERAVRRAERMAAQQAADTAEPTVTL